MRRAAATALRSGLARAAAAADPAGAASTSAPTAAGRGLAARAPPSQPRAGVRLRSAGAADAAVERGLLVDTLSMSRSLEDAGLSRPQADALTELVTRTLCASREKMVADFVAKTDLERAAMETDARVAAFRSEVSKSQDLHIASLSRDTERLTASLDKVRSEIRYEVDKLTSATRLDLNLEKGRMRDELQSLRDKAAELEIKIDREAGALKASIETTKNEALRYSVGIMVTFGTIGLGVARLLTH